MHPVDVTSLRPVQDEPGSRVAPVPRRVRLAEWLALLGLVAAGIGAVSPADKDRATYSWPPSQLPSGTPESAWYTPLVLAAQVPESLAATLPCEAAPSLRKGRGPTVVLGTSRSPGFAGFVTSGERGAVTFRVGDTLLARVPRARGLPDPGCSYRVRFEGGRWSISGGPRDIELQGDLGYMPVVSGLFSELDLRQRPELSVAVATSVNGTRPSAWQTLLSIVAFGAVAGALVLVAFTRRPRRVWTTARNAAEAAFRCASTVDAVVGVALVVWWVLSPAFFDDGWVFARQRGFEAKPGFSDYYSGVGNNLPNGYWLEWLQHWVTRGFDTLLVLRLPALLCIAALWVLCRWTLRRLVADDAPALGVARWVMAGMFLTGAMAWGMTLRPEPFTALLVTACLACAVWFHERRTARPLALLAALVPLAMTGHHAGVVALAPVVVLASPLYRWAREQLPAAVALVTASSALIVSLVFLGSDVAQWRADVHATRLYGGFTSTWSNEVSRYELLNSSVWANPMRRGWVVLMALVVVAFLLRRRSGKARLDLPAAALGVGLVLLIATPSKWPWHFGALIGIAAVAAATETVRLGRDAAEARGWSARPFVVIGSALAAILWAAAGQNEWNPLDLRTLDWASSRLSGAMVGAFGLFLLGAAVLAMRSKGRPASDAPWYLATRGGLIVTVPLIAFTVGMLAVDAAKTDAWTLARQNLGSLRGAPGCGLADELVVPVLGTASPLRRLAEGGGPVPRSLPPLPVEGVSRHLLGPSPGNRSSPWYTLGDRPSGIFLTGPPGSSNAPALEWGRRRPGRIESLGRDPITQAIPADSSPHSRWTLLLASELPAPPPDADAVRVVLVDGGFPGSRVGVSAPVTYATASVTDRLAVAGATSLVYPAVVPYFPCARQPELSGGVAQVPDHIVTRQDVEIPVLVAGHQRGSETSPFLMLPDVYGLDRLSLSDSPTAPTELVMYAVDRRIPGAVEAPPDVATGASP